MSFLSAAFLFALPLAAAPLALHLLKRRNQQVVRWGAMQFLSDAASEGRRFDRLEEWLLLALRTLALLLLVLALAQPLVRPWLGGTAVAREVVLVVDDSLSTGAESGGGPVYDAIRQRAIELVDERSEGEAIRVMLAGGGPRWLTPEAVQADAAGRRTLREALEATEPTTASADWLTCLRVAATAEREGDRLDRWVIALTDGQAHGWRLDTPGAWSRLRSTLAQGDRLVDLRVVEAGEAPSGANLAVAAVTPTRRTTLVDEPLAFRAEVTNPGAETTPAVTLRWTVDGEAVGEATVEPIAAGAARTVEWQVVLDELGPHDVVAAIAPDANPLDNEAGVVVEAVDAQPVLVVTDDPRVVADETAFLAAALGAGETDDDDRAAWRSPFRPTFVAPERLGEERLDDYRALVVTTVVGVADGSVARIESFVRDGGGLWLMLGPRIDRDAFDAVWRRGGAGLCPAPLAGLVRPESPDAAEAMIHPPDGDHPATQALADTRRLDIDRVRLRRYHRFREPVGVELTALLETGRGEPLLVENAVGRGRVLVQAFPLRVDWTDLAIARSLVVLVQDGLAYLTQPSATRYNLRPRETIELRIAADSATTAASVQTPTGESVDLSPTPRGDTLAYRHAETRLPGRYELRLGRGESAEAVPYRVARDPAESGLARLTEANRATLEQSAGLRFGAATAGAESGTIEPRPRLDPAWGPLLFALVALMAGESFLATRLSRARYGQAAA